MVVITLNAYCEAAEPYCKKPVIISYHPSCTSSCEDAVRGGASGKTKTVELSHNCAVTMCADGSLHDTCGEGAKCIVGNVNPINYFKENYEKPGHLDSVKILPGHIIRPKSVTRIMG